MAGSAVASIRRSSDWVLLVRLPQIRLGVMRCDSLVPGGKLSDFTNFAKKGRKTYHNYEKRE